MSMDLDNMLQMIKDKQWSLADIDWEAPGAELIEPELHAKLKPFIADLMWIENVGARGFAALAKKAPNPTLKSIYEHFHAEEQKHANAELALMRRWGMLENDEIPSPSINVQLVINWLDKYSDGMSLSFLGTVIPMLEVALDGALIKFITDEVKDPMLIEFVGGWLKPSLLIGVLSYVPLLNKMRDNIVAMGVDEERLYGAMKRYKSVGERNENVRRLPNYRVISWHAMKVINRKSKYHITADLLVKLTGRIPMRLVENKPTWSQELTYEPVA